MTESPALHGIRMSVHGTGNKIALRCACQRAGRRGGEAAPVQVRSSWTVAEALAVLVRAGHR